MRLGKRWRKEASCAVNEDAQLSQKQTGRRVASARERSRQSDGEGTPTCIAATSFALIAATIASAFQHSFLHLMHTRTGLMYS